MTVAFSDNYSALADFGQYLFVTPNGRVRSGTFCSGRFTTAAGQLTFDLKDVAGWWPIPTTVEVASLSHLNTHQ